MHLRHPRQAPIDARTDSDFSYPGVSKGLGTRQSKDCYYHSLFLNFIRPWEMHLFDLGLPLHRFVNPEVLQGLLDETPILELSSDCGGS